MKQLNKQMWEIVGHSTCPVFHFTQRILLLKLRREQKRQTTTTILQLASIQVFHLMNYYFLSFLTGAAFIWRVLFHNRFSYSIFRYAVYGIEWIVSKMSFQDILCKQNFHRRIILVMFLKGNGIYYFLIKRRI